MTTLDWTLELLHGPRSAVGETERRERCRSKYKFVHNYKYEIDKYYKWEVIPRSLNSPTFGWGWLL